MDDEIRAYLESKRSESTKELYGLYTEKFLEFHEVTAKRAIEWDHEVAWKRMMEYATELREQGLAGSTIITVWGALKGFFYYHDVYILKKPPHVPPGKTYLDYIPTREDLVRMENAGEVVDNYIVTAAAFCGPRFVDIRTMEYQTVKKGMESGEEIPTIYIKQQKTNHWYVTFISPQTKAYLQQHLDDYERDWGSLRANSPVLHIPRTGTQFKRKSLGDRMRRLIVTAVGRHPTGEPFRLFRPYGLRKYFRRGVQELGDSIAEFLMGRKGIRFEMATVYNGLDDLDPVAIDQLKKDYLRVMPQLETRLSEYSVQSRISAVEKEQKEIILVQQAKLLSLESRMDEIQDLLRIKEKVKEKAKDLS